MRKGQRVTTPYGPGTVAGFEAFDLHGMMLPPVEVDPGSYSRVLVRLDCQENWVFHDKGVGLPHFWRRELTELED